MLHLSLQRFIPFLQERAAEIHLFKDAETVEIEIPSLVQNTATISHQKNIYPKAFGTVKNLHILGDSFIVFDEKNFLVDQAFEARPQRYFSLEKTLNFEERQAVFTVPKKSKKLKGRYILLPYVISYAHIFEAVSRLLIAKEHGLLEGAKLLVSHSVAPYLADMLTLFNVKVQSVIMEKGVEYLPEETTLISPLFHIPSMDPLFSTLFWKHLSPDFQPQKPATKKLFISREKAGKRIILNQKEVEECALKAGYEKVFLEDLSFLAQAQLMMQAKWILAQHGGGLANICFARPETNIIELMGLHHFHKDFVCASEFSAFAYALGQNHAWLLCDQPYGEGKFPKNVPLNVNINALKQILREEK
ncbi:MAG: glycosyltransferase family 61 protein [Alphaproteobacteria bacterium]